jgi:hypothetical protein
MIQEKQTHQFRGVVCLHCKAPIPVPAIVVSVDRTETSQRNSSVFNLRCPVCQKEKPYRTREIVTFEGTPETAMPAAQPSFARPLGNGDAAKAAKA